MNNFEIINDNVSTKQEIPLIHFTEAHDESFDTKEIAGNLPNTSINIDSSSTSDRIDTNRNEDFTWILDDITNPLSEDEDSLESCNVTVFHPKIEEIGQTVDEIEETFSPIKKSVCNNSFGGKKSLNTGSISVKLFPPKALCCSNCEFTTNWPNQLRKHRLKHKKESLLKCSKSRYTKKQRKFLVNHESKCTTSACTRPTRIIRSGNQILNGLDLKEKKFRNFWSKISVQGLNETMKELGFDLRVENSKVQKVEKIPLSTVNKDDSQKVFDRDVETNEFEGFEVSEEAYKENSTIIVDKNSPHGLMGISEMANEELEENFNMATDKQKNNCNFLNKTAIQKLNEILEAAIIELREMKNSKKTEKNTMNITNETAIQRLNKTVEAVINELEGGTHLNKEKREKENTVNVLSEDTVVHRSHKSLEATADKLNINSSCRDGQINKSEINCTFSPKMTFISNCGNGTSRSCSLFKCSFCDYKSRYRSNVSRHALKKHKVKLLNPRETVIIDENSKFKPKSHRVSFYCQGKESKVVAPRRNKIQQSSSGILKCYSCDYKSVSDSNMIRHCRKIHDDMQVIYYKIPTFKSSLVPKSNQESISIVKQVNDVTVIEEKEIGKENLSSPKLSTCSFCNFQSKYRQSVIRHIRLKHGYVSSLSHNDSSSVKEQLKKDSSSVKEQLNRDSSSMKEQVKKDSSSVKEQVKKNSSSVNEQVTTELLYSSKISKCTLCNFKSKWYHNLDKHFRKKHGGMSLLTPPSFNLAAANYQKVSLNDKPVSSSKLSRYNPSPSIYSKNSRNFEMNLITSYSNRRRNVTMSNESIANRDSSGFDTENKANEKENSNNSVTEGSADFNVNISQNRNTEAHLLNSDLQNKCRSILSEDGKTRHKILKEKQSEDYSTQNSKDINCGYFCVGKIFHCSFCSFKTKYCQCVIRHIKRRHCDKKSDCSSTEAKLKTSEKLFYAKNLNSDACGQKVNGDGGKRKNMKSERKFRGNKSKTFLTTEVSKCSYCHYESKWLGRVKRHILRKHKNVEEVGKLGECDVLYTDQQEKLKENGDEISYSSLKNNGSCNLNEKAKNLRLATIKSKDVDLPLKFDNSKARSLPRLLKKKSLKEGRHTQVLLSQKSGYDICPGKDNLEGSVVSIFPENYSQNVTQGNKVGDKIETVPHLSVNRKFTKISETERKTGKALTSATTCQLMKKDSIVDIFSLNESKKNKIKLSTTIIDSRPKILKNFRCLQCSYEARWQSTLERHSLKHVNMGQCRRSNRITAGNKSFTKRYSSPFLKHKDTTITDLNELFNEKNVRKRLDFVGFPVNTNEMVIKGADALSKNQSLRSNLVSANPPVLKRKKSMISKRKIFNWSNRCVTARQKVRKLKKIDKVKFTVTEESALKKYNFPLNKPPSQKLEPEIEAKTSSSHDEVNEIDLEKEIVQHSDLEITNAKSKSCTGKKIVQNIFSKSFTEARELQFVDSAHSTKLSVDLEPSIENRKVHCVDSELSEEERKNPRIDSKPFLQESKVHIDCKQPTKIKELKNVDSQHSRKENEIQCIYSKQSAKENVTQFDFHELQEGDVQCFDSLHSTDDKGIQCNNSGQCAKERKIYCIDLKSSIEEKEVQCIGSQPSTEKRQTHGDVSESFTKEKSVHSVDSHQPSSQERGILQCVDVLNSEKIYSCVDCSFKTKRQITFVRHVARKHKKAKCEEDDNSNNNESVFLSLKHDASNETETPVQTKGNVSALGANNRKKDRDSCVIETSIKPCLEETGRIGLADLSTALKMENTNAKATTCSVFAKESLNKLPYTEKMRLRSRFEKESRLTGDFKYSKKCLLRSDSKLDCLDGFSYLSNNKDENKINITYSEEAEKEMVDGIKTTTTTLTPAEALPFYDDQEKQNVLGCVKCGFKTTRGKYAIDRHLLKHINVPLRCPRCNNRTNTVKAMALHMKVKHRITNFKKYFNLTCAECKYQFSDHRFIKLHELRLSSSGFCDGRKVKESEGLLDEDTKENDCEPLLRNNKGIRRSNIEGPKRSVKLRRDRVFTSREKRDLSSACAAETHCSPTYKSSHAQSCQRKGKCSSNTSADFVECCSSKVNLAECQNETKMGNIDFNFTNRKAKIIGTQTPTDFCIENQLLESFNEDFYNQSVVETTNISKEKKQKFECSYCTYKSTWGSSLRRHLISVHGFKRESMRWNKVMPLLTRKLKKETNKKSSKSLRKTNHDRPIEVICQKKANNNKKEINVKKLSKKKNFSFQKERVCSKSFGNTGTVASRPLARMNKHNIIQPHHKKLIKKIGNQTSVSKTSSLERIQEFNCSFCSYKSRYKNNLKRHLISIHKCESSTQTSSLVPNRKSRHQKPAGRMFRCSYCSYKSYKNNLNLHLKTMHGHQFSASSKPSRTVTKQTTAKVVDILKNNRKATVKCAKPANGTKTANNQKVDKTYNLSKFGIKSIHGRKTDKKNRHCKTMTAYSCLKCDMKTIWISTIKRHIVRLNHEAFTKITYKITSESGIPKVVTQIKNCASINKSSISVVSPKCKTVSARNGKLPKKRSCSTQIKELYACPYCPYKTPRQSNLKQHKLLHGKKNLTCSKCDYKTNRIDYLKVHNLKQHVFKCSKCKKYKTDNKIRFDRHLKRCHN